MHFQILTAPTLNVKILNALLNPAPHPMLFYDYCEPLAKNVNFQRNSTKHAHNNKYGKKIMGHFKS